MWLRWSVREAPTTITTSTHIRFVVHRRSAYSGTTVGGESVWGSNEAYFEYDPVPSFPLLEQFQESIARFVRAVKLLHGYRPAVPPIPYVPPPPVITMNAGLAIRQIRRSCGMARAPPAYIVFLLPTDCLHRTITMSERPEYVKCIYRATSGNEAWCGKRVVGFTFLDIDHAAEHGKKEGRLLACPECVAAVTKALNPWTDVDQQTPNTGVEVLVRHVLGDRSPCPHAYDVAYLSKDGRWVFPWDRTNQNPPPQWVRWWMPIPKAPDEDD